VEHAEASRGDDGKAGVSGKAVAAGAAGLAAAAGIAAVAAAGKDKQGSDATAQPGSTDGAPASQVEYESSAAVGADEDLTDPRPAVVEEVVVVDPRPGATDDRI
jgi:hypothetical protein